MTEPRGEAFARSLSSHIWRLSGLGAPFVRGPLWVASFALAGALPLLLGAVALGKGQQPLTAIAIFLLLLAAARERRPAVGILGIGLAFAVHGALAIALAAAAPARAEALMPDGAAYWRAQRAWIDTGIDPEYDPRNWVPQHAQLVLGTTLLGIPSLGMLGLVRGVYEVDLMNFYVGRLWAVAGPSFPAALLAWHPWSLCRGVGFALLTFEIASFGLSFSCRTRLSSLGGRALRLGLAAAFLLADASLKYSLSEPVRARLHAALHGAT